MGFGVFGISVFIGTALGYCSSYALLPTFYKVMNEDSILPDIPLHFNLILTLYLIVLPTVAFALIAIIYSYYMLHCPALELLLGKSKAIFKKNKLIKHQRTEMAFLKELKQSIVKSRASLIFFIAFASFCYADMMQMSFGMNDVASPMFAVILITIGIILSFTTLLLAITTVINANTKTISMMKVFGYSLRECSDAILNGYRPVAYVGFAIGTVYQFGLMKIMISVFSKANENIPEYNFDVKALIIVLISFAIIYEATMFYYSSKIKKISIKEIML
jgi:putative ABC transport system permease protein